MIFANSNIKSLFKAGILTLFAAIFTISFISSVSAKEIICGHAKCNLETRKCIKHKPKYSPHYIFTCIGKTESIDSYKTEGYPVEEIATSTTYDREKGSTKVNGSKELSSKEETVALRKAKAAGYTDTEKNTIIEEYYASQTEEKLEPQVERELSAIKEEDLQTAMKNLASYTGKAGYTETKGDWGDSDIKDALDDVKEKLDDLLSDGKISQNQYDSILSEAQRLHKIASDRLIAVAEKTGENYIVEDQKAEQVAVQTETLQKCATTQQLRARYNAGCWSCLVLEHLTSAFLHAAKNALPVVQKAGITLLILGSSIWLMFWALKSVSSFTQVQLGNILNDLLKFMFKVAIAYWFISLSSTAISQYFIRPIMSVGAIIGQQFWDEEVAEYTEAWADITEEDYKEMAEQFEKDEKSQVTPVTPEQTSTPVTVAPLTEEQQQKLDAQPQELKVSDDIPDFTLPGCNNCRLTSPSGPRGNCGGVCSSCHGGADFGAKTPGVEGDPVWAIAPGKIHSLTVQSGGINTGGGAYIVVEHEAKNKKWYSVYMHLQAQSVGRGGASIVKKGQKVVAGQQIAWMGNTGSSTGAHLHLEIWEGAPFGSWEKQYSPIWISRKRKIPAKKWCKEQGVTLDPWGGYPTTKQVFEPRMVSGDIPDDLSTTYTTGGRFSSGNYNYDSIIVELPQEIKYTGPTDIMPKTVMNSILGAMRVITNTTADNMVLGNMIMCYASLPDGGAWNIKFFGRNLASFTNLFMWLEGGIIWTLGFMLTLAVSYYFIDISFKIGFAVLAIPVVMGIWPFGFGQDKLFKAISIIAKSAATFAFLALTTAFGMDLVSEALGGLEELYDKMNYFARGDITDAHEDEYRQYIEDTISLFSPTIITMLFAIIYFYKMVKGTISDLVNKFFPDNMFGDSSPMHSAATMMTSFAHKFAMKATGADLAKDIVANQTGRLAKAGLKGAAGAIAHPVKTAKGVWNGAKTAGKAVSSAAGKLKSAVGKKK